MPDAELPALGVVRDPGVDTTANYKNSTHQARQQRASSGFVPELGEKRGYTPGDDSVRSLKLSANSIPIETICRSHSPPKSAPRSAG